MAKRSVKKIAIAAGTETTRPGYKNTNGQMTVGRTGMPSTTFPGQVIYRVRCRGCGHEYGANGTDLKNRRCPNCQGGAPGEPLVEVFGPGLFDALPVG